MKSKKKVDRWTVKEERDGTTWWLIRGGAFTDKVSNRYKHRLFEDYDEACVYSGNINRQNGRATEVVKARTKYGKVYG
jgi:hypothetical protein|tara:strand:- start:420 stop:653 length:234 start_codon:yes stop_codon:yes gene_type:complete